MANIARLGVVLGLNTAEFQSGMTGAMQSLKKLEKTLPQIGLAAIAAGTALAYLGKKSIDELDRLDEVSQMIGISVEKLSSLGRVAKIEGMNIDEFSASIVKLTRTISEANTGSEEAAYAFKSMGLDPKTFKDSEDAILQISEAFSGYRDGINKTALAVQLFGKSGAQMIPFLNQGKDAINSTRGEFDSFGLSTAEAARQAGELNDTLKKIGIIFDIMVQNVVSSFLPMLKKLTDGFLDAAKASKSLSIAGLAALEMFAGGKSSDAVAEQQKLIKEIKETEEALKSSSSSVNKYIFEQGLAYKRARLALVNQQVSAEYPVLGEVTVTGKSDKPEAPAGYTKPDTKNANMLREAQRLSAEFERERDHSLEMMRIKNEMAGLTENERKVQEAVNEVLDATSKKLQEIADKREAAAGRDASAEVLAEYDKQIEAVKRLGEQYADLARIQETSSIEAQRTFSYGWNQAFQQYAEDSENYAKMAGDMFQAVTGAMSTAIDNFVENGKFSFKDFAGSIIKDLIKIELKIRASQLFRMGIGAIMGSFGGGLGGASVSGIGTTAGGEGAMAFPVAANGGTITGATLVGERGPELFVPGRSGAIIPNNNMGSALGGTTYVTNNYIDAIDTKSFEDRVLSSHNAVWAANQYANKSLQVGRGRT